MLIPGLLAVSPWMLPLSLCVCRRLREADRAGSRTQGFVPRTQLAALRIDTQVSSQVTTARDASMEQMNGGQEFTSLDGAADWSS